MDGRRQAGRRGCWIGCVGCGGAVLLLVMGAAGVFLWSQAQVVPESLRAIRLAPIPKGARGVRSAGWAGLFSAETRIRFQASPGAIQGYLADSPALQGIQPKRFSPSHRLLPLSETPRPGDGRNVSAGEADATYYPSKQAPWYTPRITVSGRRYVIPEDRAQFNGEVIVDDAAGEVYITINRS